MKKIIVFCLMLPIILVCVSSAHAQVDVVTVKPVHNTTSQCVFNVTFTNHNAAGKNIDGIRLRLTNTTFNYQDFKTPAHWSGTIDGTSTEASATSDNGGIIPNASQGGFLIDYIGGNFDDRAQISWVALNSGVGIDSGTFETICTQFQEYSAIDSAYIITEQSGADPCFNFTVINKNLQGNQSIPIYFVAFKLNNPTGGTLRPSKVTPAADWFLDSVTTYTAYFHTDNNPILPGKAIGGWKVCLRANTTVSKFDFVWFAYDQQDAFIDRDTIFNTSNTATAAASESDSVSVKAINGCLWGLTLKNYHVSNTLPPSSVVKLTLKSKTAGVTFVSAPSAPTNWKSIVTADSIVFFADSANHGIGGGVISKGFSFSVNGPTTTNFDIGWETDRAGSPYPPKVTLLSTGTLTQKCTVSVPSGDVASIGPGAKECGFKLSVTNAHNTKPESNLAQITITIPSGSGQITGDQASTSGWSYTNISATQIKFQSSDASTEMKTGDAQDLSFTFAPKTPGTDVTATWATYDDASVTAGTPLYTGTVKINCTPTINICDTFVQTQNLSSDSCVKTFTLTNRGTTNISALSVSVTNGWEIDTSSTPTNWTKQTVGKSQVNYSNTAGGLVGGAQEIFNIKFISYYPDTSHTPPPDAFAVIAVTTDNNSNNCTSVDTVTPGCLSIPVHVNTGSVHQYSEEIGVANFMIQPNPTRGSADISFDLNSAERVTVTVLDMLGHQIVTLTNMLMAQGTYHIPYIMNGLPNGTYYVRMQTPTGVTTRKLVLTK